MKKSVTDIKELNKVILLETDDQKKLKGGIIEDDLVS